ncbi:MAG: hypothetical protein KF850_17675 [Labilithrix sp.]|nr:hypothetical protein [Labilithrix sp.]
MSLLRRTSGRALALLTLTLALPHCTRDVVLDAQPTDTGGDGGAGALLPASDAGANPDAEAGPPELIAMCPSDKCTGSLATCSTSRFLCDIDVASDSNHCGSCGNKCPTDPWREEVLHAKWVCVDGGCKMACSTFLWADCNGRLEDGCETPVGTTQDCGGCGDVCPAGASCANGKCTTCGPGEVICNGICADLTRNDYHCGACSAACVRQPPGFPPAGRNAYYGCEASTCDSYKCTSPWADCNKDRTDGCEVNIGNDTQNCGACGTKCAAGEICVSGTCQCNPGPRGCDCLKDFEDISNCGACGNRCPERPSSTPTCKFGRCGNECKAGYGDCNRESADGCEVNLMKDPQHCGACDVTCATGQACIDGVCATEPCPPGEIR